MTKTNKKIFTLLTINIISLIIFLTLLKNALKGGLFTRIDNLVYTYLNTLHSPFTDAMMIGITSLGDTIPYAIFSLLLFIALLKSKKTKLAFLFFTGVLGGFILKMLIKWLVARPRPELALISASNSSFPSGHAAMTLILAIILCIALFRSNLSKNTKTISTVLLIIFALLIGFSRIYLNLHWLSDVIAGFALAGFWVSSIVILEKCVSSFR